MFEEALKRAASMADPYTPGYAWLYTTDTDSIAPASLWIVDQERSRYASIGIYDDCENTLAHIIDWMLTSRGCDWNDLQLISWCAKDSDMWQVSTAADIIPIIKGEKPCAV